MTESVPALLRRHGLRPRKGLGQNFLGDVALLTRIADAAELTPIDTVLEIGAGLGTLTRLLAARAGRVIAVEVDAHLVRVLREQVGELPSVRIVQGDVLARDPGELVGAVAEYKVVGNLPYYITSALLRHMLEAKPRPCLLVVTVQREVAERITAGPGEMSLLALGVQVYGVPRIVARIPAGAFYPPPKVDSAVLRIDISDRPRVGNVDVDALFRVARAGFGQKRKTLRNALRGGLHRPAAEIEQGLREAGIDPQRRAETLNLEEWAELTRHLGATG
jgi:16S rRNA (adenine1518-N6/adenine1519-N6)-dimethyltransferase